MSPASNTCSPLFTYICPAFQRKGKLLTMARRPPRPPASPPQPSTAPRTASGPAPWPHTRSGGWFKPICSLSFYCPFSGNRQKSRKPSEGEGGAKHDRNELRDNVQVHINFYESRHDNHVAQDITKPAIRYLARRRLRGSPASSTRSPSASSRSSPPWTWSTH